MVNPDIAVAGLSLLGTGVGSLTGIMVSNKLTNYRIEKLEEKVEKHNNLVERMVKVETNQKNQDYRIKVLEGEVND